MELHEISQEHASGFRDLVTDFREHDPEQFAELYSQYSPWERSELAKFIKDAEKLKLDWRPKAGKTSVTHYVLTGKENEVLAHGILRFPLDKQTEIDGGNLSFSVPPSRRRKGLASYCLALLLFEAVRAGLRRALVTALASDTAARRVIEKNRGELLDIVPSVLPTRMSMPIARYWIRF